MLDQSTRIAILRLHEEGHGTRAIARALGISRGSVKDVLATGSVEVPELVRGEKAEPYREQILELVPRCKGNLIRVYEELVIAGATLSYPALTAYCRRHGIGREPEKPVGRYDFEPGEEMQHDTSPHDVVIGGKKRRVQTASLVLCYSRMLFFRKMPTGLRQLAGEFYEGIAVTGAVWIRRARARGRATAVCAAPGASGVTRSRRRRAQLASPGPRVGRRRPTAG